MNTFGFNSFQDQMGMVPGVGEVEKVSVNIPSLQTPEQDMGMPQFQAPDTSFFNQAVAKKQADFRAQQAGMSAPQTLEGQMAIDQPKPYDPSGKTMEQVYAETGRQSELDALRKASTQNPAMVQSVQPPQTMQESPLISAQPLPPQAVATPLTGNTTPGQKNQMSMPPIQKGQNALLNGEYTMGTQFGVRQAADKYSGGVNYGTDIIVPKGTKVAAPPGQWKVVEAFNGATVEGPQNKQGHLNKGYGNSVLIQNTETGEKLRMSHLTPGGVYVKPGQTIEGGTVLGATGASGNTAGRTGQHLDLEYYDAKGKISDPMRSSYAGFFTGKATQQGTMPEQSVSPVQVGALNGAAPQPISEQPLPPSQLNESKQDINGLIDQVSNSMGQVMQPGPQEGAQQKQTYQIAPELMNNIPEAQRKDAEQTIPLIVSALQAEGITDPNVIAYALATASHESGFKPKEEIMAQRGVNAHNDYIAGLQEGYEGGQNYRGRGLIQLTHKGNYEKYGKRIGEDLVNHPEKLLDPEISAKVLAAYIKDSGVADAVTSGDYDTARVRVQGQGALNPQFIGTTRDIEKQAQLYAQYLGL